MSEETKARLDRWMERWASRKLIVWATATAFLAMDKLGSDEWVAVADIASRWKHGDNRR